MVNDHRKIVMRPLGTEGIREQEICKIRTSLFGHFYIYQSNNNFFRECIIDERKSLNIKTNSPEYLLFFDLIDLLLIF